jgi:hypothetical protein
MEELSANVQCDKSFSDSLNRVGFRMCLRDDTGNFVKAKTMWTSLIYCDTVVGEALGLS